MIKAIETEYKGYRFRSRLEARWAVFFEKMGWSWKYEHEGYKIGWDGAKLPWLPDFEIAIGNPPFEQQAYVEVKGDPLFFQSGEWIDKLDFGCGPPGFTDSGDGFPAKGLQLGDAYKPILLLGDIPKKEWGCLFAPVLTHRKGVLANWVNITRKGFYLHEASLMFSSFRLGDQVGLVNGGMKDFQPFIIPTKLSDKHLMAALDAARSARFEHGEKP